MKRLFEPDRGDAIFDPLIQRLLNDETISFDEWLETEYQMEEEEDAAPSGADVKEAVEAREDFLNRLNSFGLSLNNRFRLCENLYGKAVKEPSDALLRLYCELVCDCGYLLDTDRSERTPEQDALCLLRQRKDSESLYAYLVAQKRMSEKFHEVLRLAGMGKKARDIYQDSDDALAREIASAYEEIMVPKGDCSKLTDNIASLLQAARANDSLRLIEPLFLYRVLTRHAQRLQKDDAPQFDMETLWRYQHYQLEENNGKNYRTCVRYLSLFEVLYKLFLDKPGVDAELSLYGFDHLSNLGQFYRMYSDVEPILDFGPVVDDIFLKFPFSCFEHGNGDNVLLESNGLTITELEKYLTAKNRRRSCALDRVAACMNNNLVELTTRFLDSSGKAVVQLCEEILSSADLPLAQQPANEKERALLLATINNALMEAQDDWAEDYLIRAGKALIGDDPMQDQ